MKASIYKKYGTYDVLKLKTVKTPRLKNDEVFIKIQASSINSSDWDLLRGKPFYFTRVMGLFNPKYEILGSDFAGIVEKVGKDVKQFQPGDHVYGDLFGRWGCFAEYVCAPEKVLARKPANMTFVEVAAMPQAAVLAVQSVRDQGKIKAGQRVLINGAGGGAGSFAVQLAKSYQTEVTGVDSAEKLDFMRSLGADYVIDYAQEDFTKTGHSYDLVIDFAATRSIFECKRVLNPNGIYLVVGGTTKAVFSALLLGPLASERNGRKLGLCGWEANTHDLDFMAALFTAGKVIPSIDRCFPLQETAAAFRYFGEGFAKGKVVITMD